MKRLQSKKTNFKKTPSQKTDFQKDSTERSVEAETTPQGFQTPRLSKLIQALESFLS